MKLLNIGQTMNFTNLSEMIEKENTLISQLLEHAQNTMKKSEKILSQPGFDKTNIVFQQVENILATQQQLVEQLKNLSCPSLKDIPEMSKTMDVSFRNMAGDIFTHNVVLTDCIGKFYYDFMDKNGYNSCVHLLYKIKFFYEDKNGEMSYLDYKSGMSWLEIFGEETIPLIHFLIEDNLTEKKKKSIVDEARIYFKYNNVTSDMDDETLYSHYHKWFIHAYRSNSGSCFFVKQCVHLFQPK